MLFYVIIISVFAAVIKKKLVENVVNYVVFNLIKQY
jgi:hypothetical protein